MHIPKSHIVVLLFERFSNHCLANAIEPLRAANDVSEQKLYSWEFASLKGGTVTSSSGLPVQTEKLDDTHKGEMLFVMPSYGFEESARAHASRSLLSASKRFQRMVGMDMGAWALAAAGLLDGRKATIHWEELDRFAEAFPEVEVEPHRFLIEPDIATCAGAVTAFEMLLEMIAQSQGPMMRLDVAGLLMHGERNDFHAREFRPTGDQLVDGAVALMRRNLEEPLTIGAIADAVGQTQRQLEHLFDAKIGRAPLQVYKTLRLNEAARLSRSTRFSITEVAIRSGYSDPSALTRAFREQFGQTPSEMRRGARIAEHEIKS